jgi:hypothetical protein
MRQTPDLFSEVNQAGQEIPRSWRRYMKADSIAVRIVASAALRPSLNQVAHIHGLAERYYSEPSLAQP